MTPWKFIKHYALEIYTVIAMMLLTVPAFMGELSSIQKFMVIYSVLFVLHEWEALFVRMNRERMTILQF